MWKGLKNITNYKTPSPSTEANQQLAEDLNEFYCRFESPSLTSYTRSVHPSTQPLTLPATPLSPTPALLINADDVRQVFRKNKSRKAPGPDGVTPACLKTCADQLAPIYSQIFNRSLELCEVKQIPCTVCANILGNKALSDFWLGKNFPKLMTLKECIWHRNHTSNSFFFLTLAMFSMKFQLFNSVNKSECMK